MQEYKCKWCWETFIRYNTIKTKCTQCTITQTKQKHIKFNDTEVLNEKRYEYKAWLKRTRIKPISDKKKQFLKDTWWEKSLFRKILIERQVNWCLICEICWNNFLIENAQPVCFAHILSKKDFPHLRLFENNIKLVCPNLSMNSCHTELDKKVTWNKLDIEKKILNWETINFSNYI